MRPNIALIGFMGAGKTAVGKRLALRLKRAFVETDDMVERRTGRSIAAIFAQDGEPAFRRMEAEAVAEASQGVNQVISCGGGVVLNPANVKNLRRTAVIIYLKSSPQTILKRTANDGGKRPLLNTKDRPRIVREMLAAREPLYEQAADITLDVSSMKTAAVAERIIREAEEDASRNP